MGHGPMEPSISLGFGTTVMTNSSSQSLRSHQTLSTSVGSRGVGASMVLGAVAPAPRCGACLQSTLIAVALGEPISRGALRNMGHVPLSRTH